MALFPKGIGGTKKEELDKPVVEPVVEKKDQVLKVVERLLKTPESKPARIETKGDVKIEQQVPTKLPVYPSTTVAEEKIEAQLTKSTQVPPGLDVEFEVHNPRFMKSLPRYEPKIKDHSSIIEAKKCLLRYFFRVVLGYVPKDTINVYFPWGTAYHIFRNRLTELYGYGDNEPKVFDEEKAKKAYAKAAAEALMYWNTHGEEQKPDSPINWFTSQRLASSLLEAFKHWTLERKQGKIKVLATEQLVCVQLPDGSYTNGKVDEVVEFQGEVWGRDYKTTSKSRDFFKRGLVPNDQFKRYTYKLGKLTGRTVRGLIIQVLYNSRTTKTGDKGPEIYEEYVEVTKAELERWEQDSIVWNKILDVCRETDTWPASEVNCAWCPYHRVCQKPTEAAMEYELRSKYKISLWNPAVDLEVD